MSIKFPTIEIVSPINSRAWVLPYYLEHLYNLEYPRNLISFHFLLNNVTDNSKEIFLDFKKKYEHEYCNIKVEEYKSKYRFQDSRTNEIRLKYTYHQLSDIRNKLLKCNASDYLFSVDSDILVKPDTLNKLLSANVDICAGLIWNGYRVSPNTPWKYPNIMRLTNEGKIEHISNFYVKNAPTLKESKVVEVGVSGAVILLSKKVCENVEYSWDAQGEDIGFALDCRKKGYKIYVDYSAYCQHIMSLEMLDEYKKSKMGAKK